LVPMVVKTVARCSDRIFLLLGAAPQNILLELLYAEAYVGS